MFGAGGDSIDRGAQNIIRLAQLAPGVNGLYFDEDSPAQPNPEALDVENQDRLAEVTAQRLSAGAS